MTTITQLEKAEEITDNMELAVDTITATNSITVKELADYVAGLSQDVNGLKNFIRGLKLMDGVDFGRDVTKGINPSANTYWAVRFNDQKNGGTWQDTRLGVLECTLEPSGNTNIKFGVYPNTAGSSALAGITCGYASNVAYATAPRVRSANLTSTSSTDIATIADVNSRINNIMNNRVIEYGTVKPASSDVTVTLKNPLSYNTYGVLVSYIGDSDSTSLTNGAILAKSKTNTNFKIKAWSTNTGVNVFYALVSDRF